MVKSPSAVVSIVPPRKKTTRAELSVLNPYITQISLWSSHSAQNDSIRFENAEVAVNPWVARVLHRFCNAAMETGDVEDLVTRSVAIIAKCRTDLATEVEDTADQRQVYSRQAEMMLAAAIGTVLVRELQQQCNEMLATGDNDDAKELTQLQHETRRVVRQVRNAMDDGEKERVSQLATSFLPEIETGNETSMDLPARSAPPSPTVPGAPRAGAPRSRKSTRAASRTRPVVVHVTETPSRQGRIRSLAFYLIAAAILVGSTIYWVAQHRNQPIVGDASESLITTMSDLPGVTSVQDRNPYVVLTVHEGFWDSSTESRRKDWIKDLSQLAERHGYSGLVVHSTGGTPLAEWVRGRGIQFPAASDTPAG